MRGKKGYIRRWKYEGASFKFFKWKKNIIEFNRDLSCIDRIDKMISKEVDDFLATEPK